jgi:hypothetical protein
VTSTVPPQVAAHTEPLNSKCPVSERQRTHFGQNLPHIRSHSGGNTDPALDDICITLLGRKAAASCRFSPQPFQAGNVQKILHMTHHGSVLVTHELATHDGNCATAAIAQHSALLITDSSDSKLCRSTISRWAHRLKANHCRKSADGVTKK